MENLTKPTVLSEISYPVFKIGKEIPSFENGISFYLRQYKLDFGEVRNDLFVIDDKTIEEPSLAKRRLRLMKYGIKLKKLSKAVFFLGDLIKLSDRKSWFIDNNGSIFQYKKTKTAKLTFKNITKMIAIKGGGSIIEVEGLHTRFKTLYTPKEDEVYAGILISGMTNILYGVYTQLHDDTWRMI